MAFERTNGDQVIRIRERERPEHEGIQNRKERRGGPDPECERDDHDRGERPVPADLADGGAEI